MRIGVIGAGHMGSAMVKGWLKAGQNDIAVMNPENPRVTKFCQQHHLRLFNDATAMMNWHPDSLVLTTPAAVTLDVVKQFQDISPQVTMISAAAGISLANLQQTLPHHAWMRIIPNIPVAVNAGTIGMAFSDNANQLKKKFFP
ncbi:pyrroline-5-carboxylate reductase family protein [Limosilactobacillus coleohominis]|uniref:pyrroline-5-carboxylate reductase family protein n=1 Tax=Limosilactobacillus coleohominis TaxID=181675 RepID=UPI001EF591A6|nr:NAD(P)-binding domain-containing protein [Limosilactobacillus coleohominis]